MSFLLLAWIAAAHAAVVDRVAAVVGDEVITLSEVYEVGQEYIDQRLAQEPGNVYARREVELEVLDGLISRTLVNQEITRLGLEVSEADVDAAIDDVASRNGMDRDQFRAELERQGIPWTTYRDEAKESLRQRSFTQAVILPRISVNEDELKDAWRRRIADANLPEVIDLGALFLAWPLGADDAAKAAVVAQADAIRARVAAGEDFSALATINDQGPYGAQGGHMGTFRQGELVETLDVPAFALPKGGVSAPIALAQGVFLLYAFDRRTADAQPFEEVRDQIFDEIGLAHKI